MGTVEINRLYLFLIEHQELDPAIARQLLLQILDFLQKAQKEQGRKTKNNNGESVEKDHEMF